MKVRSKASLRSATSFFSPLPLLSPSCQLKQHFGKVQAGSRGKRRCCWAEGPSPPSCCCPSCWALWKAVANSEKRRAWEENRPSFPWTTHQDHGGSSSEIDIGSPVWGGGHVHGGAGLSRVWLIYGRIRVGMFPLGGNMLRRVSLWLLEILQTLLTLQIFWTE